MEESVSVCVTGASSYIGSWLINKLLLKGYTVHATLRDLGDESKVGLLKSLHEAERRLLLFQADIHNAEEFEPAIRGCEFVFLVATPKIHYADSSKYKDTTEAAVAAVSCILQLCEQSGSVKRVIYTGSVTSASPLKEDGTGFNDFIDESCWTPLHLSFAHCEDFVKSYISSKTLSECELLNYKSTKVNSGMEVVSLACGLVGGDAILPNAPLSVQQLVSPLTGDPLCYKLQKFLQALVGSIPVIHIEDLCDAHVFCLEKSSVSGRFLCASAYPTMQEIVEYYKKKYPFTRVPNEFEGTEGVRCGSQKLAEAGFKYRYGLEQVLDDSVECMKRLERLEGL
nr:dihydroflavonol 4-reductase [Lycoris sprengeri]